MIKFSAVAPVVAVTALLALPAQAAVVGGASLDLTNGTYLIEQSAEDLFLTIDGTFFAQSLITDFDLQTNYFFSIFFELDEVVLLDEEIDAGVFSINDLFSIPDVQFGLDILSPLFSSASGMLDLGGQIVDYNYQITDSDANSVTGLFLFETLIEGAAFGLSPQDLPPEGTYSLSLALFPVPLPATLPMLLAGFGGLAVFRRRRPRQN